MPERSTITQITQIAAESTPGTAVPATKLLQALSIEPAIKANITTFRPMGGKYATIAALGKEWVEGKISGDVACYNHLAYLLSGILGYAAPAQQGGSAAYLWTFTPAQGTEDTIKTFTVEQGSPLRAGRFAYGLIDSLGLKWDRDKIEVSGSMLGQAYQDNIHLSTDATYTLTANASPPTTGTFTLTYGGQTTANIQYNSTAAAVQAALEALSTIGAGNVLVTATVATGGGTLAVGNNVYTVEFINALGRGARTLTGTFTSLTASGSIVLAAGTVGAAPTAIGVQPVLPTGLDVYLDTTSGGIGGTKLTRHLSGSLDISDRFGTLWAINSAVSGFAAHVETPPKAQVKLLVEADSVGMGLLTPMRAGDKRYIRVIAVGPLIASTYYYTLQIDLCGVVSDVGEFSDEDGVYALEYTFDVAYDSAWSGGRAMQVLLTNILTAL